ncbi:MAG: hypothetical protein R2771_05455 [Saprospiraceae bacterium]
MKKNICLLIVGTMLLLLSCNIKSNSVKIKKSTIDTIVQLIFNDYGSSLGMERSSLKVKNMICIVDTLVGNESYDINQEYFLNYYRKYSTLIDLNITPDHTIVGKYLTKNFPKSHIKYSDDYILQMDHQQAIEKLRNEDSVLFKYSHFYKLPDKDIYFFGFYSWCGKLCGGQYFIRFSLDENGDLEEYKVESLIP